jgi:hypothetical protein
VSDSATFADEGEWRFVGNFQVLGPLFGRIDYAYRRTPSSYAGFENYDEGGRIYFVWLFGKVYPVKRQVFWSTPLE